MARVCCWMRGPNSPIGVVLGHRQGDQVLGILEDVADEHRQRRGELHAVAIDVRDESLDIAEVVGRRRARQRREAQWQDCV